MILQIHNDKIVADLAALMELTNVAHGDCMFVTSEGCVYSNYNTPKNDVNGVWLKDSEATLHKKVITLADGYTDVSAYYTLINELRIAEFLPSSASVLITDFSILGLTKTSPSYHRGRKKSATYTCPTHNLIVVEKIFSDVIVDGLLTGLEVVFNWYSEDGTIGLTKTEVVKTLNKAEAKTELRKRRERQIDFLLAGAESTPIESIVDALIAHYATDVDMYITHGTDDWENAINNESNGTILTYLGIEVPRTDNPNINITIKNSMLYQITGDTNLLL